MAITNVGQPVSALSLSSGTSGTFSAFSPNAGSTYVVVIAADTDNVGSSGTLTVSWATGGSGTWAQAYSFQSDAFSPVSAVWWVTCSASPGSSTITVTSNSHINGFAASVNELTGVAASPVGATTNVRGADLTISLTPTATGGLGFAALGDRSEPLSTTANAASTTLSPNAGSSNGETLLTMCSSSTLTNGTPVAIGLASGSPTDANWIAVEILAGAGGTDATVVLQPTVANITIHS